HFSSTFSFFSVGIVAADCSFACELGGSENTSPLFTARLTYLPNHHPPIIIIIKANNIPIKPPAVGFVPKNSVGIIFWISGDPGAIIVKDIDPKTSAAGIKRWGKPAARNNDTAIGYTAKPTTNKLTPP